MFNFCISYMLLSIKLVRVFYPSTFSDSLHISIVDTCKNNIFIAYSNWHATPAEIEAMEARRFYFVSLKTAFADSRFLRLPRCTYRVWCCCLITISLFMSVFFFVHNFIAFIDGEYEYHFIRATNLKKVAKFETLNCSFYQKFNRLPI